MVQIIQDPAVIRKENYKNIDNILYPDLYITPAGTGADIHKNGRYVGELFLSWDNRKIEITGIPERFLGIANRLEEYGYQVLIKSPYKINTCINTYNRKIITPLMLDSNIKETTTTTTQPIVYNDVPKGTILHKIIKFIETKL